MSASNFCSNLMMGDLPSHARWSYFYFALALGTGLGSHTFVSSLKTAIFIDVVGVQHEPYAKSLVIVVLVPILVSYSILVSTMRNGNALVAIVLGIYSVLYAGIAYAVFMSGGHPAVWVAWLLYYATETKSVIILPMIWSVMADVSSPAFAKRAYPFCIFAMQIGGMAGSVVTIQAKKFGGQVGLLSLQVVTFLMIAVFAFRACAVMSGEETEASESMPLVTTAVGAAAGLLPSADGKTERSDVEKNGSATAVVAAASESTDEPSVLRKGVEGLWLLLSRPYVFMIFWVSYANLMPRTVLDYENTVAIASAYPEMDQRMAAWGMVSLYSNAGTCVLALLGTRPLVEYFGVGGMLYVLPVTVFCCVAAISLHHNVEFTSMAVVITSIIAYGINSPCKEMLFVRTSTEIKYKAKSWSEMWGNHFMKLLGSQLNLWLNTPAASCQPNCYRAATTLRFVAVWVVLWIATVYHIGQKHTSLERESKIVS